MIEYVYSRMIATVASAAMVALVFSVSLASSDAASSDHSEEIALSVCGMVDAAFHIDADLYEQKYTFLRDNPGEDISVKITRYSILVEGERSVTKPFDSSVVLMDSNDAVESIAVLPGMEVAIRACRATFEKENTVTIELIRH